MKKNCVIFILIISVIFSQSWNTTLIGQLDYSQFVNDVWGYKADNGKEYALVGTSLGTSIVDVTTNPFQPEEVGFISGEESIWRDVKVYNHHMYISTEADMGIQVVDISDPENPELVLEWDEISQAHNIFQADGYLYVVGANGGEHIEILDVSNPAVPVRVGGWTNEYIHDVYVRDNYAYACGISSSTMYIIDVSDKTNPYTETSWTYPGAAHAAWLNEDGNYLITADETQGGNIKIWDIQNFENINMVSEWMPEGGEEKSAHNVFVREDFLYISYYVFGLQILDISDPTNPVLAGYFDTYHGEEGLYEGNWGVYPFAESCHSYVSDMDAGLVLVDFDGCENPDPDISVSPENINLIMSQGEIVTEVLNVENIGDDGSTLFYRLEINSQSSFENPGGGPDEFGYEWSDSNREVHLHYEWIDIEGEPNTEDVHFLTNDDASFPINIEFEFPFYNHVYSGLIVNPNGWIGFGVDNDEWNNISIPSPEAPAPAIFALWDDLNPENGSCNAFCSGNVYTHSTGDRFVIWFNDVAKYTSVGEEAYFDFQIVLFPSGKIKINYRNIDGVPSATIGIQNQNGTDGLLVNYLEEYVHNFLSLEFATIEVPTWISINNGENEGQIPYGESHEITIYVDTEQLETGQFSTELMVLNNAQPDVYIPLNVEVLNSDAEINLSISHIDDWNMVGLPVIMANSNFQSVFPTSITGSSYGYNGEYTQEEELELGRGYWLRFSDSGSTDITGTSMNELEVEISEDWNIISGHSQVINIDEDIDDPLDILIAGTFYEFNGNYVATPLMIPGKGYWVRSSGEGVITFSSSVRLTKSRHFQPQENLNTITLKHGDLYFGNDVEVKNPLGYSLPPKPPTGAKDIRFSSDTKLCESDECMIEVMNDGSPLTFACEIKDGESWEIVDKSGSVFECDGVQVLDFEGELETYVLRKSTTPKVPVEFALFPAHPNPFNPVTTIQFSISDVETMQATSLRIYDITGKLVETLVDEKLSTRNHSVKWNAEGVSSGVYFVLLKGSDQRDIQKVVLMK